MATRHLGRLFALTATLVVGDAVVVDAPPAALAAEQVLQVAPPEVPVAPSGSTAAGERAVAPVLPVVPDVTTDRRAAACGLVVARFRPPPVRRHDARLLDARPSVRRARAGAHVPRMTDAPPR